MFVEKCTDAHLIMPIIIIITELENNLPQYITPKIFKTHVSSNKCDIFLKPKIENFKNSRHNLCNRDISMYPSCC